jgi:hypothetical protein
MPEVELEEEEEVAEHKTTVLHQLIPGAILF